MQDEIIEILNNIKIVLIGTTHPGNIGATARAMKTMGLSQLALVNPKIYPNAEVTARAAGADEILTNAVVHTELTDAISDCSMVYASSARSRNIEWPIYNPDQAAIQIADKLNNSEKCAVVFGRESSGLSNDELESCNAMIQIPANPEYSSLNLASAVQIICYELRKHILINDQPVIGDSNQPIFASNQQMQQLYEHLEQCLADIGYYDPDKPRLLMRRLKRLYSRAQLEDEEYSILRGILTATQEACKKE
jgi:tRNA (cytidine32/uridine32-2'-O)-methyltransferase